MTNFDSFVFQKLATSKEDVMKALAQKSSGSAAAADAAAQNGLSSMSTADDWDEDKHYENLNSFVFEPFEEKKEQIKIEGLGEGIRCDSRYDYIKFPTQTPEE